MNDLEKCDYKGCKNKAVGFGYRKLYGPSWCKKHKEWAIKEVKEFYGLDDKKEETGAT